MDLFTTGDKVGAVKSETTTSTFAVTSGFIPSATFNEMVHFLRKQDILVDQLETYLKWKEKQA